MRFPWRPAARVRKQWELEPITSQTLSPDAEVGAPVVGALVYRGVSSAELEAPVTRLAARLRARVVLVGAEIGALHAVEPSRTVVADADPTTAPVLDYLVVPGGLGWKQVIDDRDIRGWLARAGEDARGILAISTGSLLLASVGRLAGRNATGHWLAEDDLAALGARVEHVRTTNDEMGRVVTASGVLAALSTIDDLVDSAQWSQRPT